MKLWDLKPGQSATITEVVEVPPVIKAKVKNLGIQINEQISCLKWSPFGGPRVFHLENGIFALEYDIAGFVEVKI